MDTLPPGAAVEPKTAHRIIPFALLALLAAGVPLHGDTIPFQGTFASDDQLQLLNFNLVASGVVTMKTFSYAGGVDGLGNLIAAGGFDPVLTLFDGAGNFLTTNNDGACGTVGIDSVTLNCFDSFLSLNLASGGYTLVLSENDNLAVGPTLADSFTQVGNGNFTCPQFLGSSGPFCDVSPSQRNGAWALNIVTESASPVPEPGYLPALLSGAALLAVARKYSFVNRKKS